MKFQTVLPLLVTLVTAQDQLPSLTDALAANAESLSALSGLIQSRPDILEALSGRSDITILAPNNDAVNALLADTAVTEQIAADPSIVSAILTYHVLVGTHSADAFTETPQFFETLLDNEDFERIEGGQRVEAVAADDTVIFRSALKAESKVVQADVQFAGGVIHVIDTVLTIPQNVVDTATAEDLTGLTGAVTKAGLADTLLQAESVTIFAPNNEAFAALGSLDDVSEEDLQKILQYHVVAGTVAYSNSLEDGEVETLAGESVQISIRDGIVYVNDAQVIVADVLISNGVVHVIDSVLRPDANPSSSISISLPQPSDDSQIPEAAAPRATAAIAVGALLGAAVMILNF